MAFSPTPTIAQTPRQFRRGCVVVGIVVLGLAAARGGSLWGGYTETVVLERDGTAGVTVRCTLDTGGAGDTLAMPYAYAVWPDSFQHSQNVSVILRSGNPPAARALVVLARSVAAPETVEYRFRIPGAAPFATSAPGDFGNYTVGYRAVNSAPSPIDRFTVTMVLPEGFIVADVVSTTPARPANGAGSPYNLGMLHGRHCITLKDTSVAQGDAVALQVQTRSGEKSPWLIVALVLAGGVYLITFRDLVAS